MTTTPARLRRLLPRLDGAGEEGIWLAACLRLYLEYAPQGLSLEDALGLATKRGGNRWFDIERLTQRDEAIRELQRQTGEPATKIAERIRRYASSTWLRDRALSAAPDRYKGTPRFWEFEILRLGEGKAPGDARQIGRILVATSKPRFHVAATATRSPDTIRSPADVEDHGPEQQRISRRAARL